MNWHCLSELDIRLEILKILTLAICAVLFPIIQSECQFENVIKKEYFNNKEGLLREFTKEFSSYASTYSAYLKISRCISDVYCVGTGQDYYLGLSKKEAAEYRLRLRDSLVSGPSCEAILNTILIYYSNQELHITIKNLLKELNSLEALMNDKAYTPERCDKITTEINKLYIQAVSSMSSEVKDSMNRSSIWSRWLL